MNELLVESILRGSLSSGESQIDTDEHPFQALQMELAEGLALYWQTAETILQGSGIGLTPPDSQTFSLNRNFFSALFLYSFFRCGVPKDRRILYTAVNQCLRGMVTGCDNILDNEYKKTLDTDLPESGVRFRSVLDIMVSERVLFEVLLTCRERSGISAEVLRKAMRASLQALTRSGAQESSEEGGIDKRRLHPDSVISTVHHFKTGLLFQCPWAVPAVMERPFPAGADAAKEALYKIGIGCQILDDMVDLARDVKTLRHNYVASVIEWGENKGLKGLLRKMASSESEESYPEAFSEILSTAYESAMAYLSEGLKLLFLNNHQTLIEPSAAFIAKRIGADQILRPGPGGGS